MVRSVISPHTKKASPVMVIPGIEGDDNLAIPPLAEGDPVAVVCVLKEGHDHAGERVAVAERVRHAVLSSAVDLRDHQDIVEEKHFSLVLARPGFLVGIQDLVKATIADQATIWHRQVRAL